MTALTDLTENNSLLTFLSDKRPKYYTSSLRSHTHPHTHRKTTPDQYLHTHTHIYTHTQSLSSWHERQPEVSDEGVLAWPVGSHLLSLTSHHRHVMTLAHNTTGSACCCAAHSSCLQVCPTISAPKLSHTHTCTNTLWIFYFFGRIVCLEIQSAP